MFGQLLSAALGVPLDRIEVRQGDTRTIPHGGGTGGSSSTIISGTTLKRAADVVIQRGRDLAAERLETSPADIAFSDGAFEVVGTDRRIGLLELAAWKPFDGDAVFADKIESFPTGVMVCEVEIDPETGASRIDRFTAVADCGVVVNPRLLAGQMHGGIAHGLGNALMEEAIYDEETGQLLTGTLMDYALPRADDLPDFTVETIVTPSPNNFLGFKGVGELPTNGAPAAVANAVLDALRPLGVRHLDMPLTADKIWQALKRLVSGRASAAPPRSPRASPAAARRSPGPAGRAGRARCGPGRPGRPRSRPCRRRGRYRPRARPAGARAPRRPARRSRLCAADAAAAGRAPPSARHGPW